ncbi:Histone deacetylase 8 [Rhizophlyctis rosea]|nr:Histone deacetylase 8 [Rhizophlyctis rosea]
MLHLPSQTFFIVIAFVTPDFLLKSETMAETAVDYAPSCEEFKLEFDCPLFPGIAEYVRLVAGGSLAAARALTSGESDIAIHWDGGRHHCKKDEASGFCYVNDIVLGILELRQRFGRVLYIDIDVHHGDGVQSAFEFTDRVMTLSFHKYDGIFFPGTGKQTDTGHSKGTNHTINVPLPQNLQDTTFLSVFTRITTAAFEAFSPDAIVMECGTDGVVSDPLVGNDGWSLTVRGIAQAVEHVLSFRVSKDGKEVEKPVPTMLLGGGGYSNTTCARVWGVCTGVACLGGVESIGEDVPEHELLEFYGAGFGIWGDVPIGRVGGGGQEVEGVVEGVLGVLGRVKGRWGRDVKT